MNTKKTSKKKEKTKSADCGFGPGRSMLEMMSNCCAGQGGFTGCSSEIEGMMESMKRQCCMPDKDAESERKRK